MLPYTILDYTSLHFTTLHYTTIYYFSVVIELRVSGQVLGQSQHLEYHHSNLESNAHSGIFFIDTTLSFFRALKIKQKWLDM